MIAGITISVAMWQICTQQSSSSSSEGAIPSSAHSQPQCGPIKRYQISSDNVAGLPTPIFVFLEFGVISVPTVRTGRYATGKLGSSNKGVVKG